MSDETERKALEAYAEREGITIEEAERRRDRAAERWRRAFEPHKHWLAEMADLETRMRPYIGAAGATGLGTFTLAAKAGAASHSGGAAGGKKPKRRAWAEWAASQVDCWDDLPGPSNPLEYGELGEIYRDGDHICYSEGGSLARSTFEKRYLK